MIQIKILFIRFMITKKIILSLVSFVVLLIFLKMVSISAILTPPSAEEKHRAPTQWKQSSVLMPDLIVWGKGECKLHASQTISASVTRLHSVLMEKQGGEVWAGGDGGRGGGCWCFPPANHITSSHPLPPHSPIRRPPFAHPSPSPLALLSPPSSITPPSQFSPHSFFSPPQSAVLLSPVLTSLSLSSPPVSDRKIRAVCC